jgi:hypothetical protein
MFPLYFKDGLAIAYISTSLLFLILVLNYYYIGEEDRQKSFVPNLALFHSVISSKLSKEHSKKFAKYFQNIFMLTVKKNRNELRNYFHKYSLFSNF